MKVCGLEDTTILVIIGMVSGFILTGLYLKKAENPSKKAKKRNEASVYDNLTEYREVEKNTIADILKQKDNQIKSLNARIKQFEPDEEENPQSKGVTWEEIQTLVKQVAPKYSQLLPLGKKQIMQQVKGLSMEEVIELVKQFTGNKEPQGSTDPQSSQYNPNWA